MSKNHFLLQCWEFSRQDLPIIHSDDDDDGIEDDVDDGIHPKYLRNEYL